MKRYLGLVLMALLLLMPRIYGQSLQLSSVKGRAVNLGSAMVIRVIEGELTVENVSAEKQVWVHYSLDDGPWQKQQAYYKGGLNNPKFESWGFSINAQEIPYSNGNYAALNAQLVFEFVTENGSVWDNNGAYGFNYRVSSSGYSPKYGRVDLGTKEFVLEAAQFRNEPWPAYANSFSGSVVVKNRSYQKNVKIYYSIDGWKSSQSIQATYSRETGVFSERWYFYTLLGKGTKTLEFYVSYEADQKIYFDSNDGRNYSIALDGKINFD